MSMVLSYAMRKLENMASFLAFLWHHLRNLWQWHQALNQYPYNQGRLYVQHEPFGHSIQIEKFFSWPVYH